MSLFPAFLVAEDTPSRDQIKKCNVNDLQSFLQQLGLPATGKKPELVDRVFQFFLNLQNPSESSASDPTASLSFKIESLSSYRELTQLLQSYGRIQILVCDPSTTTCYVNYYSMESTTSLYGDAEKLGLIEPKYILESEILKVALNLQLLEEKQTFNNALSKKFRKTSCEPRLMWKPGPGYSS